MYPIQGLLDWPWSFSAISGPIFKFFASLPLRISKAIWIKPFCRHIFKLMSFRLARLSKTDLRVSRPFQARFSKFLGPCHFKFRGQSESDLCAEICVTNWPFNFWAFLQTFCYFLAKKVNCVKLCSTRSTNQSSRLLKTCNFVCFDTDQDYLLLLIRFFDSTALTLDVSEYFGSATAWPAWNCPISFKELYLSMSKEGKHTCEETLASNSDL